MKIAIFGLGYVGLTAAGCLVKQGHSVLGIEPNEEKVRQICSGHMPIFEPGLDELLARGIREGRFEAASSVGGQLSGCELALVCVGTPSMADGSLNMSYIAEVSRQIATNVGNRIGSALTIAYRSTIKPYTLQNLITPIFKSVLGPDYRKQVELVYNPEFLRESVAINDYFNPPKIVIGTEDGAPCERLAQLYKDIPAPVYITRFPEAEMTKFVDNSWHATKVVFANEIGRICLQLGLDPKVIHQIFVADTKLNISPYYLRPGNAFGGSCLPKDVRALVQISAEAGLSNDILKALIPSNENHKQFLFELATSGMAKGSKILMLGLAFKANSDDLRESPSIDLAKRLLAAGFQLEIHAPTINPKMLLGQNLGYTYTNLPNVAELLISSSEVESNDYDLVIDTISSAFSHKLKAKRILDFNTLSLADQVA